MLKVKNATIESQEDYLDSPGPAQRVVATG